MPQQEYIKYLREFEGLSISEIKEYSGVNWRTAKSMLIRITGINH